VPTGIVSTGGRPLLERETELDAFDGPLRGALAGRGDVVVVRGPAGIGKTSLLSRVALDAEQRGLAVSFAPASEQHRTPMSVAVRMLRPLVDSFAPEERDRLFEGAAGGARSLFSATPRTPQGDRFAIVDSLFWLTASLAEQRPLMLVADDAQWMDTSSRAFVTSLAAGLEGLGICLAVGLRTGEPVDSSFEADLVERSTVDVIEPRPLGEDAVGELARSYLGNHASAALVRACVHASGGNPLLLRELLREARAQRDESDGPSADAIAKLAPQEIGNLVATRVRRCSPDARAFAEALAVLDDHAELELVAAVSGLGQASAHAALAELDTAEVARADPHPRFVHPIFRRVVHESIVPGQRAEAHVSSARSLSERGEHAAAASHLLEDDLGDALGASWAIDCLLAGAREMAERGGRERAIECIDRALPQDEVGLRAQLLLERGRLLALGRDPAGLDDLRAAIELSGDPIERAEIACVLGPALFYLVQLEESARVCREAAAGLGDEQRELCLALEASALNADRLRGVEHERALGFESDVSAGATPGERAVLVHVAAAMVAAGDRPAADVLAVAHRAWAGGALLEEVGADDPLISFLGTTLSWAEDYEATFALTDAQLEAGRASRSPVTISYALALRSGTRLRIGELAAAKADAEQVVTDLPASDPLAQMITLGWLLELLIELGEVGEAERRLESSGLTGELPELGTVDFLLLSRGDTRRAAGNPKQALADYEAVGERSGRAGNLNPAGLAWRSRAALALTELGQVGDEAGELAAEEVGLARRFGTPRALGVALRAQGLSGGDVEPLREAVEVLAGSGSRLEHARALVDLGEASDAAGDRKAAQELLAEGMDGAHRCGAHALVERAMDGLRNTGMRPRRPALRGVDALTPQQLRVAEMAARGRSNREIGEALFLTRRTVELHLTGAYRKLEIESRDELRAALE
jgi:DNA-binding CsgD family transcriptional regulator